MNRLLLALAACLALCPLAAAAPGASADAALPPGFAERLVSIRRTLHAHPELGNRETETAKLIAARLREIGLTDVRTGVAKTGVVATIPGGKKGPTVGLRAPIDAFAIQEESQAEYRSTAKGVSHACGHDAMTAMTLGAAELLWARRAQLPGSVRLIFQPAEEGAPDGEEGGAPLLLKEHAIDGLKALVTLHVDDTIPAGQAGLHPATVYAGADTFKVTVTGKAAHGAAPWKGVDSIAVAAQVVTALQQIVSRQANVLEDPVVVTVGQISGGTRPNALAGEVELRGTLRSFSDAGRAKARASLSRIAAGTAEALGGAAKVEFTEEIPPVVNDARLVALARPVLEAELGAAGLREMKPMAFADDFSVLSEKVPAVYFELGIRNEARGIVSGTHTPTFDVDESAIPLGARLLADVTSAAMAR